MNGPAYATLRDVLTELTTTEGIIGSALIGLDGIVIADHFVVDVNLEKIAALLSSVYNNVQQVSTDLKQGTVTEAWFETEHYGFYIQVSAVGILLAIARHDAPVGLVRLSMRKAGALLEKSEKQFEE
jgi:predicted regulator of Ras-like GTPase activity (Roadblock/LC7/MglB family)